MPIIFIVLIAAILFVVFFCLRGKLKIISLLFMSTPGLLALAIINSLSAFTGLFVPYSFFNITVCSFLGLPGAVAVSLFSLFFK